MSTIGTELDVDSLVLTRGRDFKWGFDNLDDSTPPQPTDFPSGELYFELLTGGEQNAIQEITMTRASGGSYTASFNGSSPTAALAFDTVTHSTEDATVDIQSALEGLSTIGAGNVYVHPAKLYPVWEIDLTLNAGVNEVQLINFTGNPTGGGFKLGYGAAATTVIPFSATTDMSASIQSALQALSAIGSGNVAVSKTSTYVYRVEFVGAKAETNMQQLSAYPIGIDLTLPTWGWSLSGGVWPAITTTTQVPGSAQFTDSMVNTLNTTVNNFFNSFDTLLGVNIEYKVLNNLNTTLTVTSLVSFSESDLATFAVNVTSDAVEGVLNAVAAFVGLFATIHVDFYWNRVFDVEFIGDLAQLPQPLIWLNTASLTGLNDTQEMTVTETQPGVPKFTKWPFVISGPTASIKIESEAADLIPARTHWQLVFLPDGEEAGGDPVAIGRVYEQK